MRMVRIWAVNDVWRLSDESLAFVSRVVEKIRCVNEIPQCTALGYHTHRLHLKVQKGTRAPCSCLWLKFLSYSAVENKSVPWPTSCLHQACFMWLEFITPWSLNSLYSVSSAELSVNCRCTEELNAFRRRQWGCFCQFKVALGEISIFFSRLSL